MKLGNDHKKPPFRVPEHYFEEFPERLAKRIGKKTGPEFGKLVSMPALVKMGIAASFLILITLGIFHLVSREKTADQILSEVPSESLIAYLEESEMTIDEVMSTINVDLILPEENEMGSGLITDDIDDEEIDEIINDYGLELIK